MVYVPDNYNYEDVKKKFNDQEEFVSLQKKYRTFLELYLDKKVHLRKIDDEILNSNVIIPRVQDTDYNFYHQSEMMKSGCLFVRNNMHIERLDEKDLSYLKIASKLNDRFIKKTMPTVIYEFHAGYTFFGNPTLENQVLCQSVVMEFSYDLINCKLENQISDVYHFIDIIHEKLDAKFKKARIPLSFLVYVQIPDYFAEDKERLEEERKRLEEERKRLEEEKKRQEEKPPVQRAQEISALEQLRKELREKKEEKYYSPDTDEAHKDFFDKAIPLFDNEDAIRMLSTPQIMAIFHILGHSTEEAREKALKIEKEVNRKYHFVDLDKMVK